MKWWEVVTECDGYATPDRFRTEEEAQAHADKVEQDDGDLRVSEGPYEVDSESKNFWYKE